MSETGALRSGPTIVCLACGADERPRRISEVEAIAKGFAGSTKVDDITSQTTALQVALSEAAAQRLVAALVLNGAVVVEAESEPPAVSVLVLITAEPRI